MVGEGVRADWSVMLQGPGPNGVKFFVVVVRTN